MTKIKSRIRHKHFRLDSVKLLRAKELLHTDTEAETIERALDLVLSEYRRYQLASEMNGCIQDNGREIHEVRGGLGSDIAFQFKKLGFEWEIPELRGHKIKPASFGRRKKPV